MPNPWKVYDFLIERALSTHSGPAGATVKHITIGLTWTLCRSTVSQGEGLGLAMSPAQYTRALPWSGTLVHRPVAELAGWVKHWDAFEAAIGLAAINSVISTGAAPLLANAVPLKPSVSPNLAVFEYFLPKLKNKNVVVVGRYPGLEQLEPSLELTVLERNPLAADLPDPACEYVLPEADWVFLTANSLVNKTFPRLAELSRDAVTVLMGPSVPWLEQWREYGVDFLAGVHVRDAASLQATVAEGGGVRIFDEAVQYHVLDLMHNGMQDLKANIAALAARREQLKTEMDAWYAQTAGNKPGRFPKWNLLEQTDRELSLLDLRYKRQWDARHSA